MTLKGKIAMACAFLMCLIGVWSMSIMGQGSLTTYTYSQFLDQVHSGRVASVVVTGSNAGAVEATCRLRDGKTARTVLPADYRDALTAMQDELVNVEIRGSSLEPLRLFLNVMPVFLLLCVWVILMFRKFPNGPRRSALSGNSVCF